MAIKTLLILTAKSPRGRAASCLQGQGYPRLSDTIPNAPTGSAGDAARLRTVDRGRFVPCLVSSFQTVPVHSVFPPRWTLLDEALLKDQASVRASCSSLLTLARAWIATDEVAVGFLHQKYKIEVLWALHTRGKGGDSGGVGRAAHTSASTCRRQQMRPGFPRGCGRRGEKLRSWCEQTPRTWRSPGAGNQFCSGTVLQVG